MLMPRIACVALTRRGLLEPRCSQVRWGYVQNDELKPVYEATETADTRRRRLLYQSRHRGTVENELLLGSFCRDNVDKLSVQQLTDFERLLAEHDVDLFKWMTGREPVPPHLDCDVMQKLKQHIQMDPLRGKREDPHRQV